jgi:integrase/recombinase XerD
LRLGQTFLNPQHQEVKNEIIRGHHVFFSYQTANYANSTLRNYKSLLNNFINYIGNIEVIAITTDEVLAFLNKISDGTKQSTKRLRYSLLSAFFNFLKYSFDSEFRNPCDNPMIRKLFRQGKPVQWRILEKEVVDEMIFRTRNTRNRLMLELMARGGMRVGEVLKITPNDLDDRKIMIGEPKSGRELEVVFIPQKLAGRLKGYVRDKGIDDNQRTFPLSYPAARMIVKKAGDLVGEDISPHDLRRHAATYASRSGTPLEIVSKIILRHSNLATTQLYLGKVSDLVAMRWIDNLHG